MTAKESPTNHSQREASPFQINNISRRQLLHLLGAGGAASLAGCSADKRGGTETGTEPGAANSTETATDTGKELTQSATIAVPRDITTDFAAPWGGVSPYYTRLLEPLVWPTRELQVKPWLATNWKATGDKTWVFELREDVTFHNGEPMNADAVIFSIKQVITELPWGEDWLHLKPEGLKKIDDMTVEVTNTDPFPAFVGTIAHNQISVQHPKRSKDNGTIGTGPYELDSVKSGQHVKVSAFEDYWGDEPQMEELKLRIIEDRNTRALALAGHEIDYTLVLPPSQFNNINNAEKTDAITQAVPSGAFFFFQIARQPTNDPKLRKALNYAISQKEVVEAALNGIGMPAKGSIPPLVWWSAHDSLQEYGPDKAKARELVKQSSYNGETLELLGSSDSYFVPEPKLVSQVVQKSAKEIGVDIEINLLSGDLYDKKEDNGEYHLDLSGTGSWSAATDIMLYDTWHPDAGLIDKYHRKALKNQGYYADMLPLLDTGKKSDGEKKKKAYQQVQHIIMDEALILPLFHKEVVYGKYKDIGEPVTAPINNFCRWEKLRHYK